MNQSDIRMGWTHSAQLIADRMPAPVRPIVPRLVPVVERIGVADVDPARERKPAPKYRCDTCEDSGKCFGPIAVNGGYIEGEIDCPDCDGEPQPDVDGWIPHVAGNPCPIPGIHKFEVKLRQRKDGRVTTETRKHALGNWYWEGLDYSSADVISYRLINQ